MLTPKVQELEQRCRQAKRASARLARVAGDAWAPLLEQGMRAEGDPGIVLQDPASSTALVLEIAGVRWIPVDPLFLGREAVRRAREVFSWLPEAVRRARESFPSLPSLVSRARESFSSPVDAVRRARESFLSRA